MHIYRRAPVWAQNVLVSAYGLYWHWLRFGPSYGDAVRGYRERDGYSAEEWRNYQELKLKGLLGAAADRVPYYRDTWDEPLKNAARAGLVEKLPLLSKEPIRKDPRAFIDSEAVKGRTHVFHTSGSTGTPVASFWTAPEIRDSLAVREVRSANWAGVSFNQPRATFSGRMVVPDPDSSGPFHRFNRVERQVYFSAFHLSRDSAPQYVDALWRHGVHWLTGYAVSYYLLAQHILELGLSVPDLRAVVTTSEKLTPEMRDVMESAYRCSVYEEYSSVENALFASECEEGRLHVSPDVGLVEILRPDGSPCDPGEVGEVVTTCLMRPSQPFIRYRLGDLASWSETRCSCGRSMPVVEEVVGRIEDVVRGVDGRELVRFHGIFVDQPHIQEGQIVQHALDRLTVRVVPTAGFGPEDKDNIVARVQARLGTSVEVVVAPVTSIPRSSGGKFKGVISELESGR